LTWFILILHIAIEADWIILLYVGNFDNFHFLLIWLWASQLLLNIHNAFSALLQSTLHTIRSSYCALRWESQSISYVRAPLLLLMPPRSTLICLALKVETHRALWSIAGKHRPAIIILRLVKSCVVPCTPVGRAAAGRGLWTILLFISR